MHHTFIKGFFKKIIFSDKYIHFTVRKAEYSFRKTILFLEEKRNTATLIPKIDTTGVLTSP